MGIPQLVSLLLFGMRLAESILGPKTGAQKKAAVLTGVKSSINEVTELSTGGQKKTWEELGPVASNLVDALAPLIPEELFGSLINIEDQRPSD